jgi:hypothetical protein
MIDFYPNTLVRKVISIGFASILVLMLVLGSLAILQLRAVNSELDRLVVKTNAKIASAYVMRDVIRQRANLLRNAVLSQDPFEKDELAQQFYTVAAAYRTAREKLVSLAMDERELAIHRELSETAIIAQPYNDRAMEYILSSSAKSLIDAEFSQASSLQNRLIELLGDLISLEENYAETARADAHEKFMNTLYLMGVILVLIMAIGVTIAVYIVQLSHRINQHFQYQASHDSLTGLVNRREFEARLGMAIQAE